MPCDGLTPELVADVHGQVVSIWQAKLRLEMTFHYDGWPVRLKKLRCLEEKYSAAPTFVDGQVINGHCIRARDDGPSPSLQCERCLRISCWSLRSRFGRMPCVPRRRRERQCVPEGIFRSGPFFEVPALEPLALGEHF
eukprot:2761392-Amphidinium_carterae.1